MGTNTVIQAKLVLLGDLGAGKTSIVVRFARGLYYECQESTIGAAFFSQVLSLGDAAAVKLDIWDTAGQERYHSLAPMYYRGAAAAIVVFDVTSTDSYMRAKRWVDELQRQGNPHLVMALVGNKVDLEERRQVGAQEAMDYAEANGLFFTETSAKTAQNVSELFYELGKCFVSASVLWISLLRSHGNPVYALPAERLMKLKPNRPAGMILHDRQRSGVGGRWRFCCSG
ncbi:LOW QUALITY PROTEIN: hypothetical protein U9M48_026499 [Paspalum notatum var. saurae]|uniref:Ras-related protein RHN1 n=1 Tax=Paspalum notatum var. saurae TaxID=547442 RepID=A0AAQ3TUN8_PASNO